MHLVAGGARARWLTTGRYSRCLVVPHGEERACFADRQVRLPLRLGGLGVAVELEGGTEGHAAIGRADVADVAGNVVASDLNVADETGVDRYRGMPGKPVIAGIGNE